MMAITLTSREFSLNPAAAKKAASRGPVFITARGRPTHVLLTVSDYRHYIGRTMSLAEALAQSSTNFDFEPSQIISGLVRPADLD